VYTHHKLRVRVIFVILRISKSRQTTFFRKSRGQEKKSWGCAYTLVTDQNLCIFDI